MHKKEDLSRRELLIFLGGGALTTSIGAVGIGRYMRHSENAENEESANILLNNLEEREQEDSETIEYLEASDAIGKLTKAQDFASALGQYLNENEIPNDLFALDDPELSHGGPGYGHFTPSFWRGFVDTADNISPVAKDTMETLSHTLVQHAAHFGTLQPGKLTSERQTQLIGSLADKFSIPFPYEFIRSLSETDRARILSSERLQTEKDIGLFHSNIHGYMQDNREPEQIEGITAQTSIAIDDWIEQAHPYAQQAGIDTEAFSEALRESNPFK